MKTTHSRQAVNNLLKKEFGLNIRQIMRFRNKTEEEILKLQFQMIRFISRQLLISYGAWAERNGHFIDFSHKRINDFLN